MLQHQEPLWEPFGFWELESRASLVQVPRDPLEVFAGLEHLMGSVVGHA